MPAFPEEWDSRQVLRLLLEAGRIGLSRYHAAAWELKADGTLVTEADRRIEGLLAAELDCPARGAYTIGEETIAARGREYTAAALRGNTWVVDPIDGTAPYAHGLPTWGTSIGLMRGGVLTAGAIILPALGEVFLYDGNRLLWADGVSLGAPTPPRLRPLVPQVRPFTRGGMIALGQDMAKHGRFSGGNPVYASGCAIVALAYLLLGRFAGYIATLKLWDLAGCLPMLAHAGYEMVLLDGRALRTSLDPDLYVLDPDSPAAWSLKGTAVFAPPGVASVLRHLSRRDEGQ